MALKFAGKPVWTVDNLVKTETPPQTVAVLSHPAVTEIEALTEEYLILYKKFEEFEGRDIVKRMETIKKELQTVANNTVDPDTQAMFSCDQGVLLFSERAKITEVPHVEQLLFDLRTKFGQDVAMSVVNIAITPLRKILSEYELKNYIVEKPGARTLKTVTPMKE